MGQTSGRFAVIIPKKNNKKVIVWALATIHMPDCTVHVSWTVQEALNLKKKRKEKAKNTYAQSANANQMDS